jgi:hypothetical protein
MAKLRCYDLVPNKYRTVTYGTYLGQDIFTSVVVDPDPYYLSMICRNFRKSSIFYNILWFDTSFFYFNTGTHLVTFIYNNWPCRNRIQPGPYGRYRYRYRTSGLRI